MNKQKKRTVAALTVVMVVSAALAAWIYTPGGVERAKANDETTTSTPTPEAEGQEIEVLGAIKPSIVGEKPCGPRYDQELIHAAIDSGKTVAHPEEAQAFLSERPELQQGLNEFYSDHYGNVVSWMQDNVDPLRETDDNSVIESLYARFEMRELAGDLVVRNHQCHGSQVVDVGNWRLLAGDVIWGVELTTAELNEMMEETGARSGEDFLLITPKSDRWFVVLARGLCNNPLLPPSEQPVPPTPTTTTPPPPPPAPAPAPPEPTVPTTTTVSPTTTTTKPPQLGDDGEHPCPGHDSCQTAEEPESTPDAPSDEPDDSGSDSNTKQEQKAIDENEGTDPDKDDPNDDGSTEPAGSSPAPSP